MKPYANYSARVVFTGLYLLLFLSAHNGRAASLYWNPNGTTSVGGDGTWDTTTAQWSSVSTQSASGSLVVWNPADSVCFCAGPAASTSQGSFTITVTSAIT